MLLHTAEGAHPPAATEVTGQRFTAGLPGNRGTELSSGLGGNQRALKREPPGASRVPASSSRSTGPILPSARRAARPQLGRERGGGSRRCTRRCKGSRGAALRRGGEGAHLDEGVVDLHVGLDEAAAAHHDVLGAPRQGAAQCAAQRGRPGPHAAATDLTQRRAAGRAGRGAVIPMPPSTGSAAPLLADTSVPIPQPGRDERRAVPMQRRGGEARDPQRRAGKSRPQPLGPEPHLCLPPPRPAPSPLPSRSARPDFARRPGVRLTSLLAARGCLSVEDATFPPVLRHPVAPRWTGSMAAGRLCSSSTGLWVSAGPAGGPGQRRLELKRGLVSHKETTAIRLNRPTFSARIAAGRAFPTGCSSFGLGLIVPGQRSC